MDNLSKKKDFVFELWIESALVRYSTIIIICTAMVIGAIFLSIWEIDTLGWIVDKSAGRVENIIGIGFANLIIFAFIAGFLVFIIFIAIPAIISEISKIEAIKRYCYVPLTEEEVKQKQFKSATEYFSYMQDLLKYDGCEGNEYLQISVYDLRKMIKVCISLYPDNGGVFSIPSNLVKFCPREFQYFIEGYEEDAEMIKKKHIYEKSGKIILAYLEKGKDYHTQVTV